MAQEEETDTVSLIGSRSADRRALAEAVFGGQEVTPSPREIVVLQLVANGLTNPEIATDLEVTVETIKAYIRSVLYKLRATNRANAAAIGIRRGLIN